MTQAPKRISLLPDDGWSWCDSENACLPPHDPYVHEAQLAEAVAAAYEAASYVARNACLVPPDGGSPTAEEAAVCEEAYKRIRDLTPDDARAALDARIAQAVAAERERCAKVAETAYRDTAFFVSMREHGSYNDAVSQIAAAIREDE